MKLDGYRAVAFRRDGTVHLRSRNDNDFNARYPAVVKALAADDQVDSIVGVARRLPGDWHPAKTEFVAATSPAIPSGMPRSLCR